MGYLTRWLLVPSCLVASVACGSDRDGSSSVVQSAISGGELAPNDTGGVLVIDGKNINTCSGSLIAPNLVLTSRQCMAKLGITNVDCATSTFAPPEPATNLRINAEPTWSSSDLTKLLPVSEIHVPDFNELCGGDIALVVLQAPIDGSKATPITPRLDSEATVGEEFTALGYGPTSSPPLTRKKRAGLIVSCLGTDCPSGNGEIVAGEWGGDNALEKSDAGGPALDSAGRVFGVASRASPSTAAYTALTAHKQLIVDTAIHAAEVGGYPTPAWTSGSTDAGAGGSAGTTGSGGSGGTAGAGASGGTSSGGTGGKPAAKKSSGDDGGCSMRASHTSSAWLVLGALGIASLLRRRKPAKPE